MRTTVGGDKLDYYDDAGYLVANLLEKKILINSVISDANKGSRCMNADTKYHFLETPMRDLECMKVKHKHLPDDIRITYNLEQMKTPDDCICKKIQK